MRGSAQLRARITKSPDYQITVTPGAKSCHRPWYVTEKVIAARMDPHKAKRRALKTLCNDVRKAIKGDLENVSYELRSKDLLSLDAGAMVNQVEYRLEGDEGVWDKLIQVLQSCEKYVLVKKLKDELAREQGQRSAPAESSAPRKS